MTTTHAPSDIGAVMSIEVSFELPDPALASSRWRLACEGIAEAHPPLIAELYADVLGADGLAVGGYVYVRDEDPAGGLGEPAPNALDRLDAEWRPRVDALAAALDGLDPGAVGEGGWVHALGARIGEWAAITQGLRRDVLDPAERVATAFANEFAAHFGEGRRDDARALVEAIPSRGSRRAIAVWELSRLLRSQGSRLSATFGPTTGQRVYMQQLERARDEFGGAVPGWRQDIPSWREDRAMLTRSIRRSAMLRDGASPIGAHERRAAQREATEAELATSAPAATAAADAAVERLQTMLPEARALALALDTLSEPTETLVAAARAMWLRVGRHLEGRGVLAARADVFYLARSELLAALQDGHAPAPDEIAERRARHAAYEAVEPPVLLGAGEPDYASGGLASSPSVPGS